MQFSTAVSMIKIYRTFLFSHLTQCWHMHPFPSNYFTH